MSLPGHFSHRPTHVSTPDGCRAASVWFFAKVQDPWEPGLYEVSGTSLRGSRLRYWDGTKWMCAAPGGVYGDTRSIFGTKRNHLWRGLKEPYAHYNIPRGGPL